MRPLQRVVAFPDCRGLFVRTIGFIRPSCFQALQRFVQHRLPLFKIHIRHIEGFQLVVELLGLRQRGACAVQVKLNPRAPLFERAFVAQQRALWETGGKIEALFGGKLLAGGDERGERGDGQVQQPPRNEGAQVLLDAVTGRPERRRSADAERACHPCPNGTAGGSRAAGRFRR